MVQRCILLNIIYRMFAGFIFCFTLSTGRLARNRWSRRVGQTTWLGHGKGNEIKKYGENFFPHSLGSFYESVTEFCGFKPNYDEGKTMGLAPLGDSSVFKDEVEKIIRINEKGVFQIDLSFF